MISAQAAPASRKVLLIGCGTRRTLDFDANRDQPFTLTTLDLVPSHKPDIVWDLNVCPWPIEDNSYDEIHGYEILEHLGAQGHAYSFFEQFKEIYRILKPGGMFVGSCPRWDSVWAWGDPSHVRIINEGTLHFLDAVGYDDVGKTAQTDFRHIWNGDLSKIEVVKSEHQMLFRLHAHKPSRRPDWVTS